MYKGSDVMTNKCEICGKLYETINKEVTNVLCK